LPVHYLHPSLGFCLLAGDMSDLFSKQSRENMTWKCVDREALSSLGLTSGVRKVMIGLGKKKVIFSFPIFYIIQMGNLVIGLVHEILMHCIHD
jgi:A/G-specific adenine glycosylase